MGGYKGQGIKNRTGEKHITNEGYEIEIINYINFKDVSIRFKEGGLIAHNKNYDAIKKGNIKNPYHLSVFGVGYFGAGKYNSCEEHIKIYTKWLGMFVRCYGVEKYKINPTYENCLVAEDWHNFQVFAEWFEKNYIEDFHLDKDILQKGNKIYSPETCCFVPKEVNNLLLKSNSKRGEYPIGVSKHKNKFEARRIKKEEYIGVFETPEQAFQAYKTTKEVYIKEVADKWRGQITEQVYEALYNYKVEITD